MPFHHAHGELQRIGRPDVLTVGKNIGRERIGDRFDDAGDHEQQRPQINKEFHPEVTAELAAKVVEALPENVLERGRIPAIHRDAEEVQPDHERGYENERRHAQRNTAENGAQRHDNYVRSDAKPVLTIECVFCDPFDLFPGFHIDTNLPYRITL